MATRVYFPNIGLPPVDPPAPVGTDWEHANSNTKSLLTSPDTTALNTIAYTPDAADDLTNKDAMHRQYVSEPLKAQTLSGNVKAQFQCLETLANNNLFLTLKILVCSNDGTTTQATLLAITRDTTNELAVTLTNRNFPSTALSSFTCADGDRLVIEVGLGGNISSGAGGTVGHNGSIRWGCDASSGDLPEDDTETGTTFRPWLEFANSIKWLVEADGSSIAAGTTSVIGTAIWLSVLASTGLGVTSGTSTAIKGSVGASSCIATDLINTGAIWAVNSLASGIASDSMVSSAIAGVDGTIINEAVISFLSGALASSDINSAGSASTNCSGNAIWNSDFTSSGNGVDSIFGANVLGATAVSIGEATNAFVAVAIAVSDGSSTGLTSDAVVGSLIASTLAVSDGIAIGIFDTNAFNTVNGSSDGITTVSFVSAAIWVSGFSSAGSSIVQADGEDIGAGGSTGNSNGTSDVNGFGTAVTAANASSTADSTVICNAISITIGEANSIGSSSVNGDGEVVGAIFDADGNSSGSGQTNFIGENIGLQFKPYFEPVERPPTPHLSKRRGKTNLSFGYTGSHLSRRHHN